MNAPRHALIAASMLMAGLAAAQSSPQVRINVTPVAPMPTARMNHWQLMMPDGRVAAIGGHGQGFVSLATADIYDPATNTWSTARMAHIHDAPALAKLQDGRYIVAGGAYDLGVPATAGVDLFDPVAGTFSEAAPMNHGRANSAADTLRALPTRYFTNWNISWVDNQPTAPTTFTIDRPMLMTYINTYHWNYGSGTASGGTIAVREAGGTVYGPWSTRTLPGQGGVPNAVWIAEPNVLLPPGVYTVIDSDPATWSQNAQSGGAGFSEVWTAAGNHVGEVLVVGAWYNDTAAAQPERYNPATNQWTTTAGTLNQPRSTPLVVALLDGSALVLGGLSPYGLPYTESVERYDPATDTFSVVSTTLFDGEPGWTVTQDFNRGGREQSTLANGRLLLFARRDDPPAEQLFTVNLLNGAIEKFGPVPFPQPESRVAIASQAPIVDPAGVVYLIGYDPAQPRAALLGALIDLDNPNRVLEPANTVSTDNWPPYAGRTLLRDGRIFQAGGNLTNNFDAVANAYIIDGELVSGLEAPTLRPVLHIAVASGGPTAPQYEYRWSSSGPDNPVVNGPTGEMENVLRENPAGGVTFDPGETWTVEVVPLDDGGGVGPSRTARFVIGAEGRITFEGWAAY